MSTVTTLPCEIINAILHRPGNFQDLSSALCTCRHVYASFQENPHAAVGLLQRQIGLELLPWAHAVAEASHLGLRETTQDESASKVQAVLSKLNSSLHLPARTLGKQLATVPFPTLSQLSRTHSIVHSFVMAYSTSAWARLPSGGAGARLSPKEYTRFCRAFYRTELYFRLFPVHDTGPAGEGDGPGAAYLRTFPAWEIEQIGCVQDFLELQLSRATWDAVAHDVLFGELGIDYLTPGPMNGMRQAWLSRGIFFDYQLMTAASYDVKHNLLTSSLSSGQAGLHQAMLDPYAEDEHTHGDSTLLEDYSEQEREALFESRTDETSDLDRGPFEAWYAANQEQPLDDSLMGHENAGFRDPAYVFWDSDRLEQHNLLDFFAGDAPKSELDLEDTEEGQDAMQESFDARSEIYHKGGRGYWSSNDDECRVVWPEKSSGQ